jgi:hypothetical protein
MTMLVNFLFCCRKKFMLRKRIQQKGMGIVPGKV